MLCYGWQSGGPAMRGVRSTLTQLNSAILTLPSYVQPALALPSRKTFLFVFFMSHVMYLKKQLLSLRNYICRQSSSFLSSCPFYSFVLFQFSFIPLTCDPRVSLVHVQSKCEFTLVEIEYDFSYLFNLRCSFDALVIVLCCIASRSIVLKLSLIINPFIFFK